MHRSTVIFFFCLFLAAAVFTPPALAAAPRINTPAPDFALPDTQGRTHKISDYRGKVVVLNFWAAWCAECVHEIPSLNALYDRLKGSGLIVLGISRDDSGHRDATVSYPLLLDKTGDVFVKKFTVTRLPETIVIDREGKIADVIFGSRDFGSPSIIEKMGGVLRGKARQ
jgi:peroxiredoxin